MSEQFNFAIIDNYDIDYDYSNLLNKYPCWEKMMKDINAVDCSDEVFALLTEALQKTPTYTCCHKSMLGIDYCGITLISPISLKDLNLNILNSKNSQLKKLFEKALKENKFIICFGI